VASVYARFGPGKENLKKAFAICKSSLHRTGRTNNKGELSNKGNQSLANKRGLPDHKKKLDAYEKILKQNRGAKE